PFTGRSEAMAPEALVKFINGCLAPMTRIVLEEGGTLDKYIGDALMAFWGAPVPQEDHALRACRTALRFLEELEQLRKGWLAEGLPEIEIGVGINSGPMVVGNMGADPPFRPPGEGRRGDQGPPPGERQQALPDQRHGLRGDMEAHRPGRHWPETGLAPPPRPVRAGPGLGADGPPAA